MRLKLWIAAALAALLPLLTAPPASAEDVYRSLPVTSLALTSGSLPTTEQMREGLLNYRRNAATPQPSARLDGPGEIYLAFTPPARPSNPFTTPYVPFAPETGTLAIRAAGGQPLTGRLAWPDPAGKGMRVFKFTVPAAEGAATTATRRQFFTAKADYYGELSDRDLPGAAWFRHQAMTARAEAGQSTATTAATRRFNPAYNEWEMDRTYGLFSGGRALGENLQLDRGLNIITSGTEKIALSSLTGITTRELDWTQLNGTAKPQTDPLAALIPADQHALFFPSFQAMVDLLDEARLEGTPVLRLVESRSEDARTRERYERQLCLAADALGRLIGPHAVTGVAFTGSDPYLRAGSDVAVLFAAADPKILAPLIAARQALALQAEPAAKAVTGELAGVPWQGVCSPGRAVCSYMATVKNAVVVTNSLYQLGRIIEAAQGNTPALATLGEYAFFRTRYKLGDTSETALLLLSDATIRRWCGPRWRIGASRRTRAAAVLTELQARNLDALAQGKTPAPEKINGAGEITWAATGPVSSLYGDLSFMTPIAELPLDQVTPDEAAAYARFRDGYQSGWRRYFDPIALRLTVLPGALATDLTVMPLTLESDFRELMAVSQDAAIGPGAGDPHAGAIVHFLLAINKDAGPLRELGLTLGRMRAPGGQSVQAGNPLGWLGSVIAVYADEDPFWDEATKAPNRDTFFEKNLARLPLGISIGVSDGLKLAVFMTTLRGLIEQSAPGMTRWSTGEYKGHAYVKVAMSESAAPPEPGTTPTQTLTICYATTPRALVLSPNEKLIQRALDRLTTTPQAAPPAPAGPWLGKQVALQVQHAGLEIFQSIWSQDYQRTMQQRAWDNLPILNEWHRRYPEQSPAEFHQRFWQTRLVAPGGGGYVWNEEWQTMESTVYGHPGAPKSGPPLPEQLTRAKSLSLGLTFENDGLRGRAVLEREAEKKE